jgi:VWFA-related protein
MLLSRWTWTALACLVGLTTFAPPALRADRQDPPKDRQDPPKTDTPQKPPRPTFRAEANFVRVDVYPTANGAAVRDLTAADFELLEDGVPQKVETFEHIEVRGRGPQEALREPNTVREGRSMAEDPRARIFIIYLDTYYTDVSGSHRVQRLLVNLLDRILGPDDLFGVMTPQMSPSDLTLARKSITVEGYLSKYWFWGQRDRLYPEDPMEQQLLQCYPPASPNDSNSLARELIDRRRQKQVLDGLDDLSKYLRGVREERKAVIVVSNGWTLQRENRELAGEGPKAGQITTTPGGQITTDRTKADYGYSNNDCARERQVLAFTDLYQDYLNLLDVANRSNVSFYPIDSRGLAAVDSSIEEGLSLSADRARLNRRIETLRILANDTDGMAVVDTNNLEGGLRRIVDDLTSYYLLGYYSTNPKLDGRFRKLTVHVKRPGVSVRARRGYRAATEQEMEQGRSETAEAAAAAPPTAVQSALNSLGSARPGVPLKTSVSYMTVRSGTTPGRRIRLWALAELDPTLARGGEWLGGGQADIVVAGSDGRKVAQTTATIPAGQRSLNVDMGELTVPEGEVMVRTRLQPVGAGLPISDTVRLASLGDAASPGVPVMLRRGPTTGIKYVPTADQMFHRTERVRLELPSMDAITATRAELLDRTGKVIPLTVVTATRTDGAMTWATAELALAPLAAGDYALRLTAEAAGRTEEVVTGIRVVP